MYLACNLCTVKQAFRPPLMLGVLMCILLHYHMLKTRQHYLTVCIFSQPGLHATTSQYCWLAKAFDLSVCLLQGVQQKPLHDYFINFPGVSRWHWHPLTCLYPQGGQQGVPGSTVTFAMKQKGRWSTVRSLAVAFGSTLWCLFSCFTHHQKGLSSSIYLLQLSINIHWDLGKSRSCMLTPPSTQVA